MSSNDTYPNFVTLSEFEKEGFDFKVTVAKTDSTTAIMAIHGGKIEPGTSEIARGLSGDGTYYNLYLFEGQKSAHNRRLHLTSSHFDEPRALDLAANMDRIVTIHGMVGDEPLVIVGGMDQELKIAIRDSLVANGFPAQLADKHFGGGTLKNIANKGHLHQGVQLEISGGLRRTYTGRFLAAIKEVVPRN